MMTVNKIRVRNLAEAGLSHAVVLEKILSNQPKMLSAILIGNNIVNISASSLMTVLVTDVLGNKYVGIGTGVLTLLVLIFGEITPKTFATINNTKLALSYASSIYLITKLLTPVVYIINKLSTAILIILRIDSKQSKRIMTERELRTIVDVSHEEGVIEESEKDMLNNVFDFKESLAKDIMIPRIDVTFVSVDASYDEVLDICREYDVTMSLGDACRPGCLKDASDISQIQELITLGELTTRAWEKDVQVMIEGPGHMPLDQIAANMKIQQSVCKGAPFYVLGPLVTDVAPGYDHITAAIGGAIAASAGASFLCYVTPAEHLRLPNRDDVKEGIIASRIAAHAADIAKGIPGAKEWDRKMAQARARLDWEEQFSLAIDPEKARRYRAESKPEKEDTCSMCGNFCAVKNMNRILSGEIVSIFDE